MKRSKKYRQALEKVDRTASYELPDAIGLLRDNKVGKFDETVEVSMRLGVDPKHADQVVRGTVALPHGTGRTVRVLVLTKGEKEAEATEAGADFAGSDEFIKKIQDGWLDFDAVVASPDMMGQVGKLGRVLGPRGLMPNPKLGTVTFEVGKAVRELKAGKIEYRVDRNGNMSAGVGKLSFEPDKIAENVMAFIDAIVRARPTAAKGNYIRNITLTSTMGVGVKLDAPKLLADLKL